MVIAEEWATRGKHEFLVATSPLSPPLFLLMSPTFSGHFRIRTFASNLSLSLSPLLLSSLIPLSHVTIQIPATSSPENHKSPASLTLPISV